MVLPRCPRCAQALGPTSRRAGRRRLFPVRPSHGSLRRALGIPEPGEGKGTLMRARAAAVREQMNAAVRTAQESAVAEVRLGGLLHPRAAHHWGSGVYRRGAPHCAAGPAPLLPQEPEAVTWYARHSLPSPLSRLLLLHASPSNFLILVPTCVPPLLFLLPTCLLHLSPSSCLPSLLPFPATLYRWHGLSDTWHSWMMSGNAAGAAGAFAGFAGVGIAAKTAAPAAALMTSSAGELDSLWRSLGGASLVSTFPFPWQCSCASAPLPS